MKLALHRLRTRFAGAPKTLAPLPGGRYPSAMRALPRPSVPVAAINQTRHVAARQSPRRPRPWSRLLGLAFVLGWVTAQNATGQTPLPTDGPAECIQPSLLVRKREGIVELSCEGRPTQRFLATFGQQPVGPKLREGDERTPEGTYHISSRVETPRFHRFLGVSYPNAQDIRRAKALGITRLGGGIGIHGVHASKNALARIWLRLGHALLLNRLWGPTDGCIGVANEDIEVLYRSVRVGTPVVIKP